MADVIYISELDEKADDKDTMHNVKVVKINNFSYI